MIKRLSTATLLLVTLAGCVFPPQYRDRAFDCAADARQISETLYFGTAKPVGVVTQEEWDAFVRDVVTPRFPQGLTVWTATGQWLGENGSLVREETYVLNIVRPADAATAAALAEIVARYKAAFSQEAVLCTSTPVCVAL